MIRAEENERENKDDEERGCRKKKEGNAHKFPEEKDVHSKDDRGEIKEHKQRNRLVKRFLK